MKYHKIYFPFMFGLGLTLPTPFGTIVLLKDKIPNPRIIKHEECHVRQIERMGALKYLLTHLWARIQTRNIFAYNHPIEKECYDAEDES